ncbi:MAG: hypothetical protein P8M11_02915 [Planctomycetota bacterium]|nr:hypothetical protein [Planctomycetota bacterium]
MIGIFTILSLSLLPAAPGADDGHAAAQVGAVEPTDASGARGILKRLADLSEARQREGPEISWSRVEGVIEDLVRWVGASQEAEWPEAVEVAQRFTDLAIGATPGQRLALVHGCEQLLASGWTASDRGCLQGAQILILEALIAGGRLVGAASEPSRRAARLYEDLAESVTDPSSGAAPLYLRRSRLRLDRLRLGAPMPRFVANGTVGNELRSAQLEGEVLLIRFWDVSSPASLVAHREDARCVREFWDSPFSLIGVTKSEDREGYLRQVDAARFGGVQLFDGPISSALAAALEKQEGENVGDPGAFTGQGSSRSLCNRWGSPPPGSLFIVDARGCIRGRDLGHAATRLLVKELVAEEQARRREQILAGARSR